MSTSTDTLAPWARTGVYWAGGALFASGIGMSAFFLSQLAVSFGVDWPFAILLPLALDAGAIVGVVMWVGGTGEIETFGRRLSRLLFGLSILGNGMERALTFQPAPEGAEGIGALIARTSGLIRSLTTWDEPVATLSVWALLLVSIGLGIVFPALAYRMGHAIILARKTEDSTTSTRPKKAPAAPAAPRAATEPVAAPQRVSGPPARPAAPAPDPEAVRLPYVHDPRDLDPGTPEWQDRYDRLPGDGKQKKLEHWLMLEWEAGRSPVLTPVADRVVDGRRVSGLAKRALIDRGLNPPPAAVPDLVRAS